MNIVHDDVINAISSQWIRNILKMCVKLAGFLKFLYRALYNVLVDISFL